jgi:hypothetical protein
MHAYHNIIHVVGTAGPSSDYRLRQSRACIMYGAVNAARVRDIIKRFKSNPSDRNTNTLLFIYLFIFFFFNNIWGKK